MSKFEEVAQAIGAAAIGEAQGKWQLEKQNGTGRVFIYDPDSNAGVFLDVLARAAIEAMREPTLEMLEAASSLHRFDIIEPELHYDEHDSEPAQLKPEAPAIIFQTMIDAALAEKPNAGSKA